MSEDQEDKNKLGAWMFYHGFATGHGDTMDDLLGELTWQVKELRDRARANKEPPT